MKNKKGFIATSLMYSFFIVFALLALTILATYSHYRYLNNDLNNSILEELNQKIISKYARLYNLVDNGGFEDSNTYMWSTYNSNIISIDPANPTNSSFTGDKSMVMDASRPNVNVSFTQNIDTSKLKRNQAKIYLRFRAFKKNEVKSSDSDVTLSTGFNIENYSTYYKKYLEDKFNINWQNEYENFLIRNNIHKENEEEQEKAIFYNYIEEGKVFFSEGSPEINDYNPNNWNLHSAIINVYNSNSNWQLNFYINDINSMDGQVYIDDIIVADVTDVYGDKLNSMGMSDQQKDYAVKEYLDTYLEYFDNNYAILRYDP